MDRGFLTILAAQFFSSLGDNALLFAAIALLKSMDAPAWQVPVLQQFFVFVVYETMFSHQLSACQISSSPRCFVQHRF
jgi:hypothetical protein